VLDEFYGFGDGADTDDTVWIIDTEVSRRLAVDKGAFGHHAGSLPRVRRWRAGVTPDVSIPYAKLTLLLGLGAITETAFSICIQGKTLQQESGIDFPVVRRAPPTVALTSSVSPRG
jgi:hypothetical protein